MIDAYRIIMSIYTSYTCYYIYLLSSVFNISCGQMSVINIALSINWCDFIFFALSLAVSFSKYLHQTTDDCMYTLHHYCKSSLPKLFSKIIFILTFIGNFQCSTSNHKIGCVNALLLESKLKCNTLIAILFFFLIFDSWSKVLRPSKSHLLYRFL